MIKFLLTLTLVQHITELLKSGGKMKKLYVLLTLILSTLALFAQSDLMDYTFSYSVDTYTEIVGGTSLGNETSDEQRYVNPTVLLGGTTLVGEGFPIGFNFTFGGYVYDRFAVNTNGWICLGQSEYGNSAVEIKSTSYSSPLASVIAFTNAQMVSRIAGFARDLQGQTGSTLRYELLGSSPNRKLVIQWKNFRRKSIVGDDLNFQIILNEATSIVSITFGTMTSSSSAAAQVGMRGFPENTAINYVNRTNVNGWDQTAAGVSAANTLTLSSVLLPDIGATFSWKPYLNHIRTQFDNQMINTSSSPDTYTITNYGADPFTINSISALQGNNPEDFILTNSIPPNYVLQPGLSVNFQVTFRPLHLGIRYASIIVSTNLFDATISLSGLSSQALQLLYPNGGEALVSGNTMRVTWIYSGHPNISIKFSPDNGLNWITPILATSINNSTESFYCIVPNVNSEECIVRIEWDINGTVYDQSDAVFTVRNTSDQSTIVITQPANNAINLCLLRGSVYHIMWTTSNTSLVSIDYSIDDGDTWLNIAERVASLNFPATTNAYDWLVPDNITMTARLRVRSWANPAHYDYTDYSFIIGALVASNVVAQLPGQPNGVLTNDYSGTIVVPINFEVFNIPFVNIWYSTNGGTTWKACAGAVSSTNYPSDTGVYNWSLPGEESTNCLVKVERAGDSTVFDICDQSFEMQNSVRFRNVYGGEYINPNATLTVRWRLIDIDPTTLVHMQYHYGTTAVDPWTNASTNPIPINELNLSPFMNTTSNTKVWFQIIESSTNRILTRSTSALTITPKFINLIHPNGGETLFALTQVPIEWTSDGCTSFNLYYTSDFGRNWNLINSTPVSSTENSYLWEVPSLVSPHCSIKIQNTSTLTYMVKQSDLNFTITIPPEIDFTSDVVGGLAPVTVNFTDLSLPGIGSNVSWQWSFGDDASSAMQNPSHIYINPGTYDVSLTVTNSVGAYYTYTKENYISVQSTGSLVQFDPPTLSFMDVSYGLQTAPQIVLIRNIGNAPLVLQEHYFNISVSPFSITGLTYPVTIAPGGNLPIQIRYQADSFSTINDSLIIINNSVNKPLGGIKLSGRAAAQTPETPQNTQVSMVDNDAVITWNPVTQTVFGVPIETSYYAVFYNGSGIDEGNYYYLGWTTQTTFTHSRVGLYSSSMFYRVRAITDYRGTTSPHMLDSIEKGITEPEALAIMNSGLDLQLLNSDR